MTVDRDTVSGVDSVSSINKVSNDYIWTVDETDNLFLRSSSRADVAVFRKDYGLDDVSKMKYSTAPVRCVKDY